MRRKTEGLEVFNPTPTDPIPEESLSEMVESSKKISLWAKISRLVEIAAGAARGTYILSKLRMCKFHMADGEK